MLLPGPDSLAANLEALVRAGHPPAQAAAIALNYAAGANRAAGVLFRVGDSVLLLLRAPGAADHPLTWGLPGGSIEKGETPEQAAIRECTEEIFLTPEGLRLIDWHEGFTTFAVDLPETFGPALNEEHLGYVWAPLSALPQPLHPGVALTLARAPLAAPALAMDERSIDGNGWVEIKGNPISKAGVFPYSGRQLGLDGPDADRIFQVLRPPEELSTPECLASFRLIPLTDEHAMLGPNAQELTDRAMAAEKKGVHGVIGEDVYFEDGYLRSNLKIFSATLDALIKAGKRELSAGYRCIYDMTAGVWNGQPYDAVQRQIRGNHLALVTEGRMGPDVAIMDRLHFSLDAKEAPVADETQEGGAGSMTLAQVGALLAEIAPQVQKLTQAMASLSPKAETETVVDKEPAVDAEIKPPAGEGGEGTPAGVGATAMDERTLFQRIAQRDALARQISVHVGTFDHAEKTLTEVVAYGCEKLGIKADKGQEHAVLSGWLQARPTVLPPATVAQDAATPKAGSFVAKHLNKGE